MVSIRTYKEDSWCSSVQKIQNRRCRKTLRENNGRTKHVSKRKIDQAYLGVQNFRYYRSLWKLIYNIRMWFFTCHYLYLGNEKLILVKNHWSYLLIKKIVKYVSKGFLLKIILQMHVGCLSVILTKLLHRCLLLKNNEFHNYPLRELLLKWWYFIQLQKPNFLWCYKSTIKRSF